MMLRVFISLLILSYSGCGALLYQDAQTNGWFAFKDWMDALACLLFPFIVATFFTAIMFNISTKKG